MKYLFMLFFILSCNGHKIKVGECIQKPDEAIIWKVENIQDSDFILTNQNTKHEMAVTKSKNYTWVTVNCPD